jgi:hypothetical protein
MSTPGYSLTELPIRTTDEIQRHIVKRNKRNPFSRRYHKREDQEAITTWKSDLSGVLRVFDVCSATSVWRLLTFRVQIELVIDAHPTVSDTSQDATNQHTVVSDVHPSSSNVREGVDSRNPAVSITRILPVTE